MIVFLLEQISLHNFIEYNFLSRSLGLWLTAFVVVLAGFLFKGFVSYIFIKLLSKIEIIQNILSSESRAQFKKVLSWTVPLLAIKIAVSYVLGADAKITNFVDILLSSIFIVLALLIIELVCDELFNYLKEKNPEKLTETVHRFAMQMIKALLVVMGLIMILSLFGINVSGILTGLGLGGLAISMAAKDYLTDLIAGFSIMSEKTFEIGDYIKSPDIEGTVHDIKFRQTALRAPDQGMIFIPNSKLTQNYVINYARMEKRRVRFAIYLPLITTNAQILGLKKSLMNHIENNPSVTEDKPLLSLSSITKDNLELTVQYFIVSVAFQDFADEQEQALQLVWDYLDEENIARPLTRIEVIRDDIEVTRDEIEAIRDDISEEN